MSAEMNEDIVIVGGGIAGLATALALHRLGISSLVLESSSCLRGQGAAFTTWTNGWKALDALGVGDSLRAVHPKIQGLVAYEAESGVKTGEGDYVDKETGVEHEFRCIKRLLLLEALSKELPSGTIRYSSKVVSIEESGRLKVLHLVDGTIIKAKVLVGCDGVNSEVAKWLGFKKAAFDTRIAIRAYAEYEEGHGFGNKFFNFFGEGFRSGVVPCDDKSVYWFFSWSSSTRVKELEENPLKGKEFVQSKLGKLPNKIKDVVEKTKLDDWVCSQLRYRVPWEILWGNISKDNVCVAGDACHPMTPDLGQGACSALEDAVILARYLAEAFANSSTGEQYSEKEEYERIKMSLNKYAKERRWRACDLVGTAYVVGHLQFITQPLICYLRSKFLVPRLATVLMRKAAYDCGALN